MVLQACMANEGLRKFLRDAFCRGRVPAAGAAVAGHCGAGGAAGCAVARCDGVSFTITHTDTSTTLPSLYTFVSGYTTQLRVHSAACPDVPQGPACWGCAAAAAAEMPEPAPTPGPPNAGAGPLNAGACPHAAAAKALDLGKTAGMDGPPACRTHQPHAMQSSSRHTCTPDIRLHSPQGGVGGSHPGGESRWLPGVSWGSRHGDHYSQVPDRRGDHGVPRKRRRGGDLTGERLQGADVADVADAAGRLAGGLGSTGSEAWATKAKIAV